MYRLFIVSLCFVLSDSSDSKCVTVNFEQGFSDDFTNESSLCGGQLMWNLGRYTDIGMTPPHELSTLFIAPNTILSCIGSFEFNITAGGIIEMNIFMDTASIQDIISIIVNEFAGNSEATVAQQTLGEQTPGFVRGWNSVVMTMGSSGTYSGYLYIHITSYQTNLNEYEAEDLKTKTLERE
ncbi:unnamed protein product [Colias eurytheme]|nr:unnamed protein product [Colias eurytheme]